MAQMLVTGGAGFIGSNLVEKLVTDGHQVRVIDNLSTGRLSNLADLLDQITMIEGDFRDAGQISEAARDVEVIFHQGALPSVPRSIEDPLLSHDVNVTGTLQVLLAARDLGVRRVVLASSSSVYGDQDPNIPKVETMTPKPISPYAVNKLADEYYAQVFYQVYGLETVCLRYFNVFGPRQDPNSAYAAVIPKFIDLYVQDQPPTIHGDGEQTRDFSYIANVVAANFLAASRPADQVAGQVFNVAQGGRTSLNELATQLKRLTGATVDAVHGPPREGDIKHSWADIDKAIEKLAYDPEISFSDGLEQTVAWYRETAQQA
ncbi:MAG: SDR family oxidoreductase [Chloroflexi bacterium]|nr:SDR family oxidoreductase [Chloroflexota bacterium]